MHYFGMETYVYVVDWFSSMYVPWILLKKFMINFNSSVVCSKSITALLDYKFLPSNSYHHPLSC